MLGKIKSSRQVLQRRQYLMWAKQEDVIVKGKEPGQDE